MITREQLDVTANLYQLAKDDPTWWGEDGRTRNNEWFQTGAQRFKENVFDYCAERMMWEWLVRGLSPEIALRETLEKFDQIVSGVRDQIEQGLIVFCDEQRGK